MDLHVSIDQYLNPQFDVQVFLCCKNHDINPLAELLKLTYDKLNNAQCFALAG